MKIPPKKVSDAAGNIYELLGLKDTPFSLEPVLDPYSDDPRRNGRIYATAPVQDALEKFERLLIRPNDFRNRTRIATLWSRGDDGAGGGRGMGKTALLRFFQRRINDGWGEKEFQGRFSAVVIYVSFRDQVDRRYMEQLAWAALVDVCRNGVLEASRAAMRRDLLPDELVSAIVRDGGIEDYERLLKNDVLSQHGVAEDDLDAKVEDQLVGAGVSQQAAGPLARGNFEAFLRGLRRDGNLNPYYIPRDTRGLDYARRLLFDDVVRYLDAAGFGGGYLFIDDIENLTDQMARRHRLEFAKEFGLCTVRPGYANTALGGFYSCVLTTHIAAARALAQAWTEAGLSTMARLDPEAPTSVELPLLTEEQARQILIEHLDFYRIDASKNGSIHPFSEDGLAALVRKSQHPRTLITIAAHVVQAAANTGVSVIDEKIVEMEGVGRETVADFSEGLDDAV